MPGRRTRRVPRHVLVIGGAGFIGSNVADAFRREGAAVTVFDNFSRPGAAANSRWLKTRHRRGLRVLHGDILTAGRRLRRLVDDADFVIHNAGQVAVTTSVADPRTDFQINAAGTLEVLEAVRHSRRRPPLVFSSTNKVYGGLDGVPVTRRGMRYAFVSSPRGVGEDAPLDFHSPYGCSKGAADQYVRDYARCFHMNTVVLRQSCIYGAHQYGTEDQGWVAHFVHSILRGKPLTIYGDGKQVRDLLDARDLSELYETAIEKIAITRGEIYNVGGGEPNQRNLLEVIEQVGELVNKKPQYTFSDWREGDQAYYVSDVSKARKELGWEPRIPFDRGLKDLVAWAASLD